MKRIFVSIFVSLPFLFMTPSFVFAQNVTSVPQATSSPAAALDYQLPYPGLLPDNPLYFLKAVRDKIIGFLISDPLKKADFNLLLADKRLNSGLALFNQGKQELGESTISKGENYFEKAIEKVKEAKTQGRDTNDIIRRLFQASLKHKEVLKELEKKAGEDLKNRIISLGKRVDNFEKQVKALMNK